MAVERFDDGLFEIGAPHGLPRQALEQHLALVEETGRAIAALESEVLDERFLQNRKLAVLRMALHRADRFAIEARRRHDAGRARVARPIGIINDHGAAQALRDAAAELGAR